jgi:2-polyprenyl-3-methyl-5-hydroxy-6-metoxy-1,4-benzoquinol methylase
METVIHYTQCPACSDTTIQPALQAIDHTVSQQVFAIWQCQQCSLRFTQDVPAESEIGRYYQSDNYISHTETDRGLINRLYHTVRKITLQSKRKMIESLASGSGRELLDIGAGTGAFAGYMRHHGWLVTGLEPDAAARDRARTLHNVTLEPVDSLFLLPAEKFDVITMWHVLEHVHALHRYLNQLKKLLKPGGVLLIAVPNYTSNDAAAYKAFWAAYDVPRHLYHFSPAAMKQLLTAHGLTLRAIKPMWFDSFYVSMLSEKYKTGHSHPIRGAFRGAISNWKALFDKTKCSSVIYVISK